MLKLFARKSAAVDAETPPIEDAPSLPADEMIDRTAMRGMFSEFESDLSRVMGAVESRIGAASERSASAGTALDEAHTALRGLVETTDRFNEEIAGIAGAGGTLGDAAEEITRTVSEVVRRSGEAVDSARSTTGDVESLSQRIAEIGALLNGISEIATRTNLLALNATIEAARAGEAGRGFAVVAQEVKALSVAAGKSVEAIREHMESVRSVADRAVEGMRRVGSEIAAVNPVCEQIGQAADEQRETIRALGSRMANAREAVAQLVDSARSVDMMAEEAQRVSAEAGRLNALAAQEAREMRRRIATILRSSPVADQRASMRMPVDLPVRLRDGATHRAFRTFDLSAGGVLLKPADGEPLARGRVYEAEISRIGDVHLKVVGLSALGTHCAFADLTPQLEAAIVAVLGELEHQHAPMIALARDVSEAIQAAIEADIAAGRLSLADVFDTAYQEIPGTDPVQFSTRYLERFDALLPDLIEPALAKNPKMVFCLAIDRNGYIPVHNRKFSQKQRPGEREWNFANSRNRRIFDDRAGLLAGRLTRPHLIQTYNRDMGNGTSIPMKEVDVPLVVQGRNWGGIRTAYTL